MRRVMKKITMILAMSGLLTTGIGISHSIAQEPGSKSKKVKDNGTVKEKKIKKDGSVKEKKTKSDGSVKETKIRPDGSVKKDTREKY
jgi:hypothetical protein